MTTQSSRTASAVKSYPKVHPIFVVGSVRSGTSITMNALRMGAELRGFDEGNVASMIQRMQDRVESHFESLKDDPAVHPRPDAAMLKGESEDLKVHLVNWLAELYVRTMGEGVWFDKSPESYLSAPMIRFCPQLLQAFPNARFIWCVRRGIENILSRQRKFPEVPFRACCQSWTDSVEQWIAVRDQLQGRYVEAHQHEIAIQPEKVAREIAEVLDFSKRQRRGIEDVFTHKRSEQSRFAAEHRWIGLDETPWSSEEQEVFRQICGPAMEAMSYPLEGRTLTAAGPIRLFYPVVEASVRRENVPAEDWGFCRVGERGLQLHPNGPGESPAGVRYLDVPLSGHGKIRATLEVARESVAPVIFGLRIVRVGGSEALAELECEVKPGKEHHWEAEFPPVTGSSEVVISTRMAEGAPTNHGAAAIWSDARLEPV